MPFYKNSGSNLLGNAILGYRIEQFLLRERETRQDFTKLTVVVQYHHVDDGFRHRLVSLALQKFVRASAPELMAAIPTTFNVRIAAHYSTKADGIECVVWKVTRPQQQRVLRTADQIWPPVNPPALG